MNRKTFVGASITSALIADARAVTAQTTAFGKPHPPIVPENDPSLGYARPQLPTGTGSYAALPKAVSPTTPGIVISTRSAPPSARRSRTTA